MAANQDEPLLERTYRLLDSRTAKHGQLRALCRDSGIDESWLTKFKRRQIDNPGVVLVQRLHDFLITSDTSEH